MFCVRGRRARTRTSTTDPGWRLAPPSGPGYTPPTDLKTVADNYKRMTAPIGVNGQGPFAFVVDTGANQSVISQELAARLGLATGPAEPLNGVAGIEMEPTTTARLDVGGRIQSGAILSMLPAAAIGGDGMLGLDSLEGQILTLDFGGQRLRIDPPRRRVSELDEIAVKAHRRDGQLTLVDADLAGIRLTAFLDFGAQNTIGNMALRQLAITRNPTCIMTDAPIISALGQSIAAEMAELPGLRVGSLRLPTWSVAFADLHTFRMWNSHRHAGDPPGRRCAQSLRIRPPRLRPRPGQLPPATEGVRAGRTPLEPPAPDLRGLPPHQREERVRCSFDSLPPFGEVWPKAEMGAPAERRAPNSSPRLCRVTPPSPSPAHSSRSAPATAPPCAHPSPCGGRSPRPGRARSCRRRNSGPRVGE